jgi:hypothetical protein
MLPAMLMPRNAEFYALYRDVNDCIFVRTSCHHSIFMLQQHWRQLAMSTFEKNGNIVSMTNRFFMDLAP